MRLRDDERHGTGSVGGLSIDQQAILMAAQIAYAPRATPLAKRFS
jgi:hypothetical protein